MTTLTVEKRMAQPCFQTCPHISQFIALCRSATLQNPPRSASFPLSERELCSRWWGLTAWQRAAGLPRPRPREAGGHLCALGARRARPRCLLSSGGGMQGGQGQHTSPVLRWVFHMQEECPAWRRLGCVLLQLAQGRRPA